MNKIFATLIVVCGVLGVCAVHAQCNKMKKGADRDSCFWDYDATTFCMNRTVDSCEDEPGAEGNGSVVPGDFFYSDCVEGGKNTTHCLTRGTNCLKRHYCVSNGGVCVAGPLMTDIEARPTWFRATEQYYPTCPDPE